MEGSTADCAAFDETIVFLSHFRDLEDPRQQGKLDYPLEEILLLCLFAVLADAETVTDIALFGRKKLSLLRRFRPFAKGTPAHDRLGDILAVPRNLIRIAPGKASLRLNRKTARWDDGFLVSLITG